MFENIKGKRLLLIGGINHATEIIKTAQKMGVEVYVTDYNENTPAKKMANKSFSVSTIDVNALEKLCIEEKIDGVITGFIDSMLPYCEELCRRMGYPFWATQQQIDICVNKDKFKEACRQYGVPIAKEYMLTDNLGHLNEEVMNQIEFPVIVKPVDNSGSRGVFVCKNKEELIERYNEALTYSKSKHVIIEQLIQGQHINMYYTLIDGEIILSAMADRYVDYLDNKSAPLPVCLIHQSQYIEDYQKDTDFKVRNMFKGLGMKNGVAFVQGFRTNDGNFVIYEMGYRLNGGSTYSLIDACAGYDQLKMLIHFSLTGKMLKEEYIETIVHSKFHNYGINYVVSVSNDIIGSIEGLNELKSIEGIKNVVQVKYAGDRITGKGGSSQVVAYVLFTIQSLEELKKILEQIKRTVVIKDINGKQMDIVTFDMKRGGMNE